MQVNCLTGGDPIALHGKCQLPAWKTDVTTFTLCGSRKLVRIKSLCNLQCCDFYCLVTFQICVYQKIRAFIHFFLSLLYLHTISHLLCSQYLFAPIYECQKILASFKILTGSLNQNRISKTQNTPFVEVTQSKANTHKNLSQWYVTSLYICSATTFNFIEHEQRNSLISIVFSKNITSSFIIVNTI